MQLFGEEGRDVRANVSVGDFEIKVKKASSLSVGTHPARFYPLSSLFNEGADYISIAQHVHWLNKKPIICRRVSRDYTVPETQNKPPIDTSCVICNDKFAMFAQAKKLGYKKTSKHNTPEAIRFHDIAVELMEKVTAASLVSFVDGNGHLTPPIILRYGKELLTQLELNAYRIFESTGVHLCDPVKGYMFEIIVGKNDGDFRTYKNSMPAVDTSPVDITTAPWKWNEICAAINPEIIDIPTPDDVLDFYTKNYGKSQQQFTHPSLQNTIQGSNPSVQENSSAGFVPPDDNSNASQHFVPPDEKKAEVPQMYNPMKQAEQAPDTTPSTSVPTFSAPANQKKLEAKPEPEPEPEAKPEAEAVQVFTPPPLEEKKVAAAPSDLKLCHGASPGGSGYDRGDANCKICAQAEKCYNATAARSATSEPSAEKTPNPENDANSFNGGDIEDRLGVLNNRMLNK